MKKLFTTTKKENFRTKTFRLLINLFPAYRRTGGRGYFLSSDYTEAHIKIGLNWKTRNYLGSVFGGSLYGAIDPIYVLQLLKILGKNYIVWDKSATIQFIKPVKGEVFAKFVIEDDLISIIKSEVAKNGKYHISLPVSLVDKNGIVYFKAVKEIYIANKTYYKQKQLNNKNL